MSKVMDVNSSNSGIGEEPQSEMIYVAETDEIPAGRPWIKYSRLLFSLAMFLLGIYLMISGMDLGYENRGSPGPGFFPFWVGAGLSGLSVLSSITESRADINEQVEQDIDPKGLIRVIRIVASFIVLIFIFEPLGYNIAILLYMLFLTFSMNRKSKAWVNIVVSFALSFGVYSAFKWGLGVHLPLSIIPFLSQLGL